MYHLAKMCSDKLCKSAFQKSLAKQNKKTERKTKNKHQSGHSTQRYWNGLRLGSNYYSQNQT